MRACSDRSAACARRTVVISIRNTHLGRWRVRDQLPLDAGANGIADLAVHTQLLGVRAGGRARIGEAPVQAFPRAEEHRARLIGLIADSDDFVEWLVKIAVERLALVPCNLDAQLGHRLNGQRPNARRLGPRRKRLEAVAAQTAQQPFRHLAARRVVGAQEQHPLSAHNRLLRMACALGPLTRQKSVSAAEPIGSARRWACARMADSSTVCTTPCSTTTAPSTMTV